MNWEKNKKVGARRYAEIIPSTNGVSNWRNMGVRKAESVKDWCICQESSPRKFWLSRSSKRNYTCMRFVEDFSVTFNLILKILNTRKNTFQTFLQYKKLPSPVRHIWAVQCKIVEKRKVLWHTETNAYIKFSLNQWISLLFCYCFTWNWVMSAKEFIDSSNTLPESS